MKVVKVQNNSKNCIICGLDNDLGLKATFLELDDGSVASVFKFKTEHQSYPDRTHGGMISALLDELMGRTIWVIEPQTFGVTTTLNVTYRKPVPLNTLVKARAYMTFNSARGMTAKGEIYDMDNNLLAEASSKFFKVPFDRVFDKDSSFHEEMCYTPTTSITEIDFPIK